MNSTFTTNMTVTTSARAWNVVLWTLQIILAGMFLMSGMMKITTPLDQLVAMMPWVADAGGLVRFIGISQILGSVGLILPSLLRVRPSLTVLAAAGLTLVMFLAAVLHVVRGEFGAIGINILLGGAAALVAWGRTTRSPIAARS